MRTPRRWIQAHTDKGIVIVTAIAFFVAMYLLALTINLVDLRPQV